MAAEAEHVRPGGQSQVGEWWELAEAEAFGDVAAGVVPDGQFVQTVGGCDAPVEGAGALGRLRGVLGHVSGHRGVGQLPGRRDRPDVELTTPGEGPGRDAWCGGSPHPDGTGGLADGVGQQAEGSPGRRGGGRSRGAVGADDGVKVDDAAPLVLSDLGVGETGLGGERLAGQPSPAGQGPAECDGEPAPQLGGVGVEQNRAGVVVAVGAQRLAEPVIVAGGFLVAGQADAVWAGSAVPARTAGQYPLTPNAPGMDRAERWCGEGDEHARMVGDLGGDAFTAGQSGPDELVGVGAVDLGAGRAPGGAAGLAGDRQEPAGLVHGGVAVDQLAGGPVDVIDAATQQHGLQASPGVPDRTCGNGNGGQRWYCSRRALAGGGRAEADRSQVR